MPAIGQLTPQPWMAAPATRRVMEALLAGGDEARFVGGCVRDAVLKRPVKDVDIATPATPDQVIALMNRANIKVIPTGLRHGTVTAVVDGASFEITTLRRDVACDGRHAEVAFTDNWREDAARRDFTINAMSADLSGGIHDPFEGLRDLGDARVRFVGNPRQRITEDVLRLLRFFRFFAYYGKPPADTDALAACRFMAPQLLQLSAERVRGELLKILLAPDPASVLLLMRGERVLEHILPEAANFGRLRILSWLETRAIRVPEIAPDPLRRLAAVIETDENGATNLSARLRLSNQQTDRLAEIVAVPPADRPGPDMSNTACRRALHHHGPERMRDLILMAWAERKATSLRTPASETDHWLSLLAETQAWSPMVFPLKGQDLLELGVPAGPAMGRLLKEAERWWEDGDFCAERPELLAKIVTALVPSEKAKMRGN